MKISRTMAVPVTVLLALASFTSCGDGRVDQYNKNKSQYNTNSVFPPKIISESSDTSETASVFELKFPYVISKNSVKLPDGTILYINVEMTDGEYFDSTSPNYAPGGGIYEKNYAGEYRLCVYSDADTSSAVYTEPVTFESGRMNFDKEFSLVFDDYNDDGNPDFTLGQWGSSSGNIYQIYTVASDGKIKKLNCKGLCATSFDYSIQLKKASATTFICENYDNTVGKNVELTYSWKDGEFVLEPDAVHTIKN